MLTDQLRVELFFVGPKSDYCGVIEYATIEQCYEYLQDKMVLGEDIETTYRYTKGTHKNENIYKPGLDPYLSNIVMLQIGDKERVYVIDTRSIDITLLLPLWKDKNRLWIGTNLKFEAKHLLHNYGIVHYKIWDTMLVDMNLYNGLGWSKTNKSGMRFSLEAQVGRYLGIKPLKQKDLFTPDDEEDIDAIYIDKSTRLEFLSIGNKPFTEEQILYGANDILYPLSIREHQLKGTGSYNPHIVHELENEFCLVLADIELKGMHFDQQQWLKGYEANVVVWQKRKEKLDNWVIENYKKFCKAPDMFEPTYRCDIEWSSSKQVIKLFKYIGFCPQEKSKQTHYMEYTVGAKALTKLLPSAYKELYNEDTETDIVEQKDLILNYLLYKVSEQACTTFGSDWLKYIHPITGRIHSTYRQILNTGRISSNEPNVQNIPGEEEYRSAFTALEGYQLVNADYSSQESRILAELSGDEAMIKFFNEGHPVHGNDYHSFTATKMFSLMRKQPDLVVSKKTHPDERNAAKNISFKIAYGGSAYTLKDDFGVEEDVAQEFIDGYMGAFPALAKYFSDGREKAMKCGYIDMIPDRRYWEPTYQYMKTLSDKIWSFYPKDYNKMSKEKKLVVKEAVKEEHPEIKGMWSEYFSLKGSLERCSQNYPIQALAGLQTKSAGVLFRKHQIKNNLQDKIYITNLIHDEVLIETKTEYAEEGKQIIEDCMKRSAQHFCKKVKMEATAEIVSWWHH